MTPLPFEDEIRVGDVRRDWERIVRGLQKVKDKGGADWRLEDIYALCRNNEAVLYLFDGGFCVCGRTQNRFTLAIELHIYALYSERKESCFKYLPYLEGLAKEVGASCLTMQSPRDGFATCGWDIEHISYKRSLP
jgi:hypothetical protein